MKKDTFPFVAPAATAAWSHRCGTSRAAGTGGTVVSRATLLQCAGRRVGARGKERVYCNCSQNVPNLFPEDGLKGLVFFEAHGARHASGAHDGVPVASLALGDFAVRFDLHPSRARHLRVTLDEHRERFEIFK